MNIWMIEKKSMKHHYLKKKDFCSHLYMDDNTDIKKEFFVIDMSKAMHYC